MPATYDNTTTTNGQAVTSLTTPSFTITSNANRAAGLGLSTYSSPDDISAVSGSCGGQSAAAVAGTTLASSGGGSVRIWRVINPSSGSQTASMSWTTAADAVLGVVTADSVDQTTPLTNGTSNTQYQVMTVTITSAVGDLTLAVGQEIAGSQPTGATQTERWNAQGGFNVFGTGSTAVGAASVTHTWTVDNWAATAGANFAAAAGAAEVVLPGHGPLLAGLRNRLIQHG